MEKKDLLDFVESLLVEYPPNRHLNIVNAFRTFTEKIRDPKLRNKCKWPEWSQIYTGGRTSRKIVEDILNPTKAIARMNKPSIKFKPRLKGNLDLYREAELILFRPSGILNKFKIGMPSGLFVPALMLLCSGQKVPRISEETKRVFAYCLDVLSRVVDDFFTRYDRNESTHQKAVHLLFREESGLYSVIEGKGRQINEETLRRSVRKVRSHIDGRIKGRKSGLERSGKFYKFEMFYYIAWLSSMIMELYYPIKELRKEHASSEIQKILRCLSIRDRKEVSRAILSELEKYRDESIDGRQLFAPAFFRNLPLAMPENSYELLQKKHLNKKHPNPVELGELINAVLPPLGYTN